MAKGKMPAGLKAYLAKKGKGGGAKAAEMPGESEKMMMPGKMPMAMMARGKKAKGKGKKA